MITLDFKFDSEHYSWYAEVPAKSDHLEKVGKYKLWAQHQPSASDRGPYIVYVECIDVDPLEDVDMFPRRYFQLETLKSEMTCWVNTRQECREAAKYV